jgi:hypothetical protein
VLSRCPCGGTGKAGQPPGCRVPFDNALAHGLTESFIDYSDLCFSLVAVLRFDGAMNPFDQSSQTRLCLNITGAFV